MSTTTVRLGKDLKTRVANVARKAGVSAHSLILEAIAERTEQLERMNDFHDSADARFVNMVETGKTISWDAMRAYLQRSVAGKKPRKPAARKFIR